MKPKRTTVGQKDGGCSEKPAERYQCCAADEGSTAAMISLADMSLTDADVPFWQQAARLADAEHPARRPKPKTVKRHKRQMERYILAAEAGDTDAMGALAMACHLGYPEKRDDALAFLWASRAADRGDGSAMYQAAYFMRTDSEQTRIQTPPCCFIRRQPNRECAPRLYGFTKYTRTGSGTFCPTAKRRRTICF